MNAQTFAPKLRQHWAGYLLHRIIRALAPLAEGMDAVTIDQHQSNGSFGIHQARVRLSGDPTVYRLILAPADAPLKVGTLPIGDHFSLPIGDA